MAASWISNTIASGLQTVIQPGVAAAGSFAGGAVSSVGTGVNGVGESINSYVRRYGTGIQDYGNSIRDWTAAEGPRAQTATNPLGLSSSVAGGKHRVRNPQLGPKTQASESSKVAQTPKSATPRPKGGTRPSSHPIGRIGAQTASTRSVGNGTSAKSTSSLSANRPVSSSVSKDSASMKTKGSNTKTRPGTTSSSQRKGASNPTNTATGKVKISPQSKPQNLGQKAKGK